MGITRAVAFKPVKIADTVIAEFLQGCVADHALGFVLEVVKHRLDAVGETCGLLMPGAATGVNHTTAFGTGATAGKAVRHNHPGAIAAGLQRSAGTRRPQPITSTSQVSCQSPALRRSACKGARILLLLDVCCARLMTVPAPCCWP